MTTDLAVIGSAIVLLAAVWAVTAHLINREPATPGSHARRHRSLRAAWWRLYDSSHITAARFARRYTRDQRREHEIWGDTGTTGTLPAVAESAPLDPLPADTTVYEVGELPRPVTTLNLPAQNAPTSPRRDLGGESDSPGSHELPAPRAGGHKPPLREDDQGWESSADPGDPATVAAVSHGRQSALAGDRSLESGSLSSRITGRTLAGATAGQASDEITGDSWLDDLYRASLRVAEQKYTRYADDSGLMPAVTEHIAAALGVPSRTRWLDEAFDRVLLDLHAEMAIIGHRYAYRELVAA